MRAAGKREAKIRIVKFVLVTFFTVLSVATFGLARWGEAREHSSPTATRTESST